jgi:hypothetical protein
MGVVGVVIMAALTAFGAVSTPFSNLKVFKINVDQKVLDTVKRQLMMSMDMVFSKKKYLMRNAEKSNSFWGRFNVFATSASSIESEIRNLNLFVDDLYLDMIDLYNERESHRFGQTVTGQVLNILGYVFSGICIYKILNALFQLSLKKVGLGEGPVTTALTMLSQRYHLEIDVKYWSNVLSLLLIAVLMVSSIRSFLLESLKVLNLFLYSRFLDIFDLYWKKILFFCCFLN